ncbi:MAG: hypothetical protein IT300_06415 [Dehalococcoidia bacterium]|nr:hypothetical protein [Dehalococcoidia bacterium]
MKTRLYVAAVLGGLALLIAVALVVFAFGRHNPSPPSLQDNPRPEIPGQILYVDQDFCFVRAAASGEGETRLACIPESYSGAAVYWLDDLSAGIVRYDQRGGVLWRVDLVSGVITDTGKLIDTTGGKVFPGGLYGGAYAPDGAFASTDEEGRLSVIVDGQRTEIADFDSPEYNPPRVLLWSPDSRWLALQYFPRRAEGPEIWVVSRDGAVRGTLTKNAGSGSVAWRIAAEVQPPNPR